MPTSPTTKCNNPPVTVEDHPSFAYPIALVSTPNNSTALRSEAVEALLTGVGAKQTDPLAGQMPASGSA